MRPYRCQIPQMLDPRSAALEGEREQQPIATTSDGTVPPKERERRREEAEEEKNLRRHRQREALTESFRIFGFSRAAGSTAARLAYHEGDDLAAGHGGSTTFVA